MESNNTKRKKVGYLFTTLPPNSSFNICICSYNTLSFPVLIITLFAPLSVPGNSLLSEEIKRLTQPIIIYMQCPKWKFPKCTKFYTRILVLY